MALARPPQLECSVDYCHQVEDNVTVAGIDIVKNGPRIRSLIGLLPESTGYYNWMNAEEYLLHFAGLYKIDTYISKKRARDLLDAVGACQ